MSEYVFSDAGFQIEHESMKPNETMAHDRFITELLCNQN